MHKTVLSIAALVALGSISAFADGTLRYGIAFDRTGQSSSLSNIAESAGSASIAQSGYVNWTAEDVATLDGTAAHLGSSSNWSVSGISDINTTDGFTIVFNASSDFSAWKDFIGFTVGTQNFKFETNGQTGISLFSQNNAHSPLAIGNLTASAWYTLV